MNASEREMNQEENIYSESKAKVQIIKPEDKDSNSECYNMSDGKLVRVDVDKKVTGSDEKDPTLALLTNRSEEFETNIIGDVRDRSYSLNQNTTVRRSNRKYKPLERSGNMQFF